MERAGVLDACPSSGTRSAPDLGRFSEAPARFTRRPRKKKNGQVRVSEWGLGKFNIVEKAYLSIACLSELLVWHFLETTMEEVSMHKLIALVSQGRLHRMKTWSFQGVVETVRHPKLSLHPRLSLHLKLSLRPKLSLHPELLPRQPDTALTA